MKTKLNFVFFQWQHLLSVLFHQFSLYCVIVLFFYKNKVFIFKEKNSNIFSPPQENNEVKLQEWYLLIATRELGPIKENGLL